MATATTTQTINENNWSGNSTDIQWNPETGELKVHGSNYRVIEKPSDELDGDNEFRLFDVQSEDHDWDVLFTGCSYKGHLTCTSMDISRGGKVENRHMYIAQLICNIV